VLAPLKNEVRIGNVVTDEVAAQVHGWLSPLIVMSSVDSTYCGSRKNDYCIMWIIWHVKPVGDKKPASLDGGCRFF
jgi:hypothetical protein